MNILMLSLVIATSIPLESFAVTLANGIESTVENESEETDQNKQVDGSSENEGVSKADNKDFIGPIQTGESQNANDGPTVETREVPEELKQFFIGEEDLHAMSSYFEQQELADQSDEWQQLKKESMLRSTTYRLSENGRTNANVARYTPSGLHYTHSIRLRSNQSEEQTISDLIICILEKEKQPTDDLIRFENESIASIVMAVFGLNPLPLNLSVLNNLRSLKNGKVKLQQLFTELIVRSDRFTRKFAEHMYEKEPDHVRPTFEEEIRRAKELERLAMLIELK